MSSILKVDTIQDASGNAIISSDGSGNISIPNLTTTGDINFGDSDKAIFGAGNDLQIYHDGTNSFVLNTIGELIIRNTSDDKDIFLQSDDGSGGVATYVNVDGSTGSVNLRHYGDIKLATTSSGIDVTGTVVSDGLTVDTDTLYVDSTNNRVGVGTTSPATTLDVDGGLNCGFLQSTSSIYATSGIFRSSDGTAASPSIQPGVDNDTGFFRAASNTIGFSTAGNERMRINNFGYVGIDQTNPVYQFHIRDAGSIGTSGEIGWGLSNNGNVFFQSDNSNQMFLNDTSTSAGGHNYIFFRYNGATIGDIDTLDNNVVRYQTFTGGHWSQFHDGTNPELKKGTVMSLTGDKLEYSKCEKTITKEDGTEEVQKFEIAGTHEIGSEVTVPNDEYGEENSTTTATVVSNSIADHLVKVKVSDSVADKGVYGVWAGKYSDGDLSVEALGTSKIRIKQGEVLEVGDLLESAGDGTAQKQTDDTIKNSTIAKVTSPTVIKTFDDNSFLVSCVLYCG